MKGESFPQTDCSRNHARHCPGVCSDLFRNIASDSFICCFWGSTACIYPQSEFTIIDLQFLQVLDLFASGLQSQKPKNNVYFQRARHSPKQFTCINSFNHNRTDSMHYLHFTSVETEAQMKLNNSPLATQLGGGRSRIRRH